MAYQSRRPHSYLNQHTEAELKLIRDMRRRNPQLGLVELWHCLKQRGYTRRSESLFWVMRKLGLFPQEKKKKAHTPKPYQQMTRPGERIQVDVKIVPRCCITDPELRLFQLPCQYFLHIFRLFMAVFTPFHLLSNTLCNQCFRVFHVCLWLVMWSENKPQSKESSIEAV